MKNLSQSLNDYLSLRRSLGFKMQYAGQALPQFVSFLNRHRAKSISARLAVQWAVEPQKAKPGHWAQRLTIARGFAKYLRGIDLRTEIPPTGILPYGNRRRKPHIYATDETQRLLKATRTNGRSEGIRPKTYVTLFGLLSVTGVRLSEAVNLDDRDVDLDEGLLTIRESKCRKSRLIPIHATTVQQLALYRRERNRLQPRRVTSAFFVLNNGNRPRVVAAERKFLRVARKIGLRGPAGTKGPYLHDFRHTFAVNTLRNWYRSGMDVEHHMPQLSAYLGHAHMAYTYWYLSAEPELLELAARRLDDSKGNSQ